MEYAKEREGISGKMNAYILWLVVLVVLSGFFAASETALTSVGRAKALKLLRGSKGKLKEKAWKEWIDNPQYMLTVILIGNNVVNIVASAISTKLSLMLFPSRGIGIAVGIISFLILTFGEIMPKGVAIHYADTISNVVILFVYSLGVILFPVVKVLTGFSFGTLSLLGIKMQRSIPFITSEDLQNMMMYEDSPGFESEERKMIRGVIEFKDLIVREVMIPRTDMVCIESGTTVKDAIDIAIKEGFSRFPVYEDNIDNIKGILYVKDMIRIIDRPELMEHNIEEFVREPYFVPETKKVKELFDEFREKKLHVAIVVDEFGGTSGIITMEDILEEIVGEIEDEFDRQLRQVRAVGKGVYMVDARLHIDDLRDIIHIELPKGEEFDTVGGFLLERFGRIPNVGDKLVYDNVEFEVVDASPKRIKRIKIKVMERGDGREHGQL